MNINKRLSGFIVVIVVATLLLFIFVVQPWLQNQNQIEATPQTVNLEEVSLGFTYMSGEHGYSLIEPPVQGDLKKAFILMSTPEYVSYQQSGNNDSPPAISVFVFAEPGSEDDSDMERPGRITRLQNWAIDNTNITAFDKSYGTPEIVELDGLKALNYQTDGSYQQDIYIAGYHGNIYMFVGQYKRPTDAIKKDFQILIDSVSFD